MPSTRVLYRPPATTRSAIRARICRSHRRRSRWRRSPEQDHGDINPSLTYVATGLVNNDTLSGSLSTSAGQFSGVGAYAINQARLRTPITRSPTRRRSVDHTEGHHGGGGYAEQGLRRSQSVADLCGDGSRQQRHAEWGTLDSLPASSPVSARTPSTGARLANAIIRSPTPGADLSITPKAITVVADAQSKVGGDPQSVANLWRRVSSTTMTLSGGSRLQPASSPVSAPTPSTRARANANYSIIYTGADLSIPPKAITVAADAQEQGLRRSQSVANPCGNGSPSTTIR